MSYFIFPLLFFFKMMVFYSFLPPDDRTFNIWNQSHTHPLFAESDARYQAIALGKMRKLLLMVMVVTVGSVVAWTTITFFGESVKGAFDKTTNETYYVEVPRLPIKSWYPWDAMGGVWLVVSFVFQVSKIY